MLKYILAFFILIHGLIQQMGFAKAFGYGNITQLNRAIAKPMGMLWLLAALLFTAAFILFMIKKDASWIPGLIAILIS